MFNEDIYHDMLAFMCIYDHDRMEEKMKKTHDIPLRNNISLNNIEDFRRPVGDEFRYKQTPQQLQGGCISATHKADCSLLISICSPTVTLPIFVLNKRVESLSKPEEEGRKTRRRCATVSKSHRVIDGIDVAKGCYEVK